MLLMQKNIPYDMVYLCCPMEGWKTRLEDLTYEP